MPDFKVCFAAGTPLRTPTGSRAIEELAPGDLVLSRDEYRPDGLVTARRVEEVFVREGLVWELRLGGQTIRTTAEHPFYSERSGWTACHELQVGDRLLTEDGSWVAVEGLRDTGSWERVYNLRVADDHTYFVGEEAWGFSAWAHNEYTGNRTQASVEAALRKLGVPAEEAYFLAEMGARKGVDGNKWIGEFEAIAKQLHPEAVALSARSLMHEPHASMAQRHPLLYGENGVYGERGAGGIYDRPSGFRTSTESAVDTVAPRNAQGDMICTTCRTQLDRIVVTHGPSGPVQQRVLVETVLQGKNGPIVQRLKQYDHFPETWSAIKSRLEAAGATRQAILDAYNNPAGLRVQCRGCNISHLWEGVRGPFQ
ncbi:MAG: polymorphic toxin-type HINT domain-containing protein [Fimbriiglobus sp.]